MTKPELAFLERLFSAEIESALSKHGLPPLVQSKSKVATKLAADGLIREKTVTLGGRFAVTITGWELTALGHMTYCMSCPD